MVIRSKARFKTVCRFVGLIGLIAPSILVAPGASAAPDYYDNRSTASDVIVSYYNAINRAEYARAYSYRLSGTPRVSTAALNRDYEEFRAGHLETREVALRLGREFEDTAVGTTRIAVPFVIRATSIVGVTRLFAGCYQIIAISPSDQDYVPFDPIRIEHGSLHATRGSFASIPMPDCRF